MTARLQSCIDQFNEYVQSFSSADQDLAFHVKMKQDHTHRVTSYALELANYLNLSDSEQELSQIMALFHDLGRFEQYRTYRTFRDALSVNHAELSLKELEKLSVPSLFNEEETHLICLAIRLHNAIALPPDLTEQEQLFATILRDCDKLDIFYVLEAFLTPPGSEGCSPILLDDLKHQRQSLFTNMKTAEDRKLIRLCWVYDIQFSWTMNRLLEKGHIEKIFDHLPKTDELQSIKKNLTEYMMQKGTRS